MPLLPGCVCKYPCRGVCFYLTYSRTCSLLGNAAHAYSELNHRCVSLTSLCWFSFLVSICLLHVSGLILDFIAMSVAFLYWSPLLVQISRPICHLFCPHMAVFFISLPPLVELICFFLFSCTSGLSPPTYAAFPAPAAMLSTEATALYQPPLLATPRTPQPPTHSPAPALTYYSPQPQLYMNMNMNYTAYYPR